MERERNKQFPSGIVCLTFLPDFERNSARFPSKVDVAFRTLDVGRLSILTSSLDKGASQIEGFNLMNVGNGVQIPYENRFMLDQYSVVYYMGIP